MFVGNSTGILKKVLMSKPSYLQAAPINEIAKKWAATKLDTQKMEAEHAAMTRAYADNGVEVTFLNPDPERPNSVFSRDFGACIREGYILGKFREPIRFPEHGAYKDRLEKLGVPLVTEVKKGLFEGGDFCFLDDTTIAIGIIARSNPEGVAEIRRALEPLGYTVIGVPCEEKYLHLDLCYNMVAEDLAVAFPESLPEEFLSRVKKRGIELIPVSSEAVFQHGCNVQAIGARRVISLKHNGALNEALSGHGITVIEVDITEILKAGGGPHCMSFPLERI
jgi:N-dimethylarginine dimethylaminohydrolase